MDIDKDNPDFHGETYDPDRDHDRLATQLATVRDLMHDGNWRTLDEIAEATGHPAPSVSARLRDLRKRRFGGFTVQREHVENGLHRYRVLPPAPRGGDDADPVRVAGPPRLSAEPGGRMG